MIFRKLFSKKTKSLIACATMATLLMTSAIPAGAASKLTDSNAENSIQTIGATPNYRSVMYYGDWSVWDGQSQFYPKDIPAEQLTHLNFSFLDFDQNGELKFTDKDAAVEHPVGEGEWTRPNSGILNAFQLLRARNPNLKIGVSLGGWSKSNNFSLIARDPALTEKFVNNVMKFIKYTNMDFVDVDWEYPAAKRDPDKIDNKNDEGTIHSIPEDKENFIKLLKSLRNGLNKQGAEINKTYELTVAIPAPNAKVDLGIDVPELFKVVDFANIMTYDMRGAWDKISGHQTGLYTNPNDPFKDGGLSVDESVKHYISKGAPSEKIVIGAAYYSRGWEKVTNENIDPKNPGLFGSAAVINKDADNQTMTPGANNEAKCEVGDSGRKGGVWSYRSFDKLKAAYPGLKEYWDDSAKAPYMYNESTGAFFTYDNVRSIQEKCKYIKDNNLGGMIAWMAGQDKPTTSTKRDELTKATKEALFGSAALPAQDIITTPLDISCEFSLGGADWTGKRELIMKVKNNEKLQESNDVLKRVEAQAKTAKMQKYYIKTEGITITGGEHPVPAIKQEDGYYVLDFSADYNLKFLEAGQSMELKFKTSENLSDVSGIKQVLLSQRIIVGTPEISKQVIFGPKVNTNPVINASDRTIELGSQFKAMEGVTATDKEDGDLTSKVKYSGSVNTNVAGTYKVTYTVTDSANATTTKVVTITVAKTDIITIAQVADRYNSVKGDSRYDVKYDLNADNIIDIYDIVIVSKRV